MAARGGAGGANGGDGPARGPGSAPGPDPKRNDDAREEHHVRGAPRKSFPLRLPPKMFAELRAWANQDLRSLNAQIEYLLAEALRRRKKG